MSADSLMYAIYQIESTYGDTVSFADKGKSVLKFGKNDDLDTGSTETVWNQGGDETYSTTNDIDTISSSSSSDTEVVRIEGHTVSGTGSDSQFTFVVQFATLNGQNKVVLDTPLARCSRVNNTGSTALVGDVYVYPDGAITSGVPDDQSTVKARILAGGQQTFKCATTFSNIDYFAMSEWSVGVRKATNAVADFTLEIRRPGGIFLPVSLLTASQTSGNIVQEFKPFLVVPKNSDVRVVANTTANNTTVSAFFDGYLGLVQPDRHSINRSVLIP